MREARRARRCAAWRAYRDTFRKLEALEGAKVRTSACRPLLRDALKPSYASSVAGSVAGSVASPTWIVGGPRCRTALARGMDRRVPGFEAFGASSYSTTGSCPTTCPTSEVRTTYSEPVRCRPTWLTAANLLGCGSTIS